MTIQTGDDDDNVFCDSVTRHPLPPRKPLEIRVDLVLAIVFLAMLFAAFVFSELDSTYESYSRITTAMERVHRIWNPNEVVAAPANEAEASARGIIVVAAGDNVKRLVAKTTLERYGYDVALADSAADALQTVRGIAPRVVLVVLDATALRTSVQDTVRQLNTLQPGVRILLAGAHTEGRPEMGEWMKTPFTAMALAEAVQRTLLKP